MPITALFALPLAILYIVLAFRVIRIRRQARVEIGDGGARDLLRRIRVHSNAAEYIPLGLLTMGLAESQGAFSWLVAAIGATLLTGRIAHAYALSQEPHILRMRVAGMMLTFTAITTASMSAFALALVQVIASHTSPGS